MTDHIINIQIKFNLPEVSNETSCEDPFPVDKYYEEQSDMFVDQTGLPANEYRTFRYNWLNASPEEWADYVLELKDLYGISGEDLTRAAEELGLIRVTRV